MRTLKNALGVVLILGLAGAAHADMIVGTASGGAGATLTGTNALATATGATFGTGVVDLASGTYASYFQTLSTFPNTTVVMESPLSFTTGASTFTATFGGEGTFTATSQVLETQTANAVNLFLLGEFTPAGDFAAAGYTASPTSFSIAFTQVNPGASVGYTFSLNTPPSAVPVPPSIVMALTSAAGLGVLRRFGRRNA